MSMSMSWCRVSVIVAIFLILGETEAFSVMHQHAAPQRRRQLQSPRTRLRPYTRTPTSMHQMAASSNDGNEEQKLTPERVAEMVEASFVPACLQLAKGFVDVLKLLIVAIKAGYEMNMSPQALIERVDAMPDTTAGRPLMPEEVQLRNTWIHVVYLVLEFLGHARKLRGGENESEKQLFDIDDQVRATYAGVLPELQQEQERGGEFPANDSFLSNHSFAVDDPMKKAIASQSLRVIWLTLTVLREEEVCSEEKSGLKAQPPIPGAFE